MCSILSVRAGARRPRIPEEHLIACKARAAAVHSIRDRGACVFASILTMLYNNIIYGCVSFPFHPHGLDASICQSDPGVVENLPFLLGGTKVVILRSVHAGARRPRMSEEHFIASKARAAAVHSVRERGVS